jgi:hypothetical protein
MSSSEKKEKDEYVTLRVKCRKSVYVTTYGTVDLKVPRANRRRVRSSWTMQSHLVEGLDGSHCIEWGESTPGCSTELIVGVETLPESDQAYRCRFNQKTKRWELEEAEGDGDED